jgi:hypothetical protein
MNLTAECGPPVSKECRPWKLYARYTIVVLELYSIQEILSPQLYLDVYYKIRLHVSTACSHP